jgi:hypothetical protein
LLVLAVEVFQVVNHDHNPRHEAHMTKYHHTTHSIFLQAYEQIMEQLIANLPNLFIFIFIFKSTVIVVVVE